ncbi:MAG: ribonuclease P protein component [Kiloniellales bacterium]
MASALGRLKTRSEYLRVAAGRCKWAAPGMVVQTRQRTRDADQEDAATPPTEAIRVGFTASRKVGNAVARNRARRRLRAACSEVMPEMGQAGYDYVLIARNETLRRPYPQLLDDLRTALARLAAGRDKKPDHRGGRP